MFFLFFFFFQKSKAVPFVIIFLYKRLSSSDHLNVITTNINIYFDYILVKTGCKNGHHKAMLWLHMRLLISEKSLKQLYLY